MIKYEYRVLPAPRRGQKAKGVKTGEARFAHALELLMNEMGAKGWEYQRTDTLPVDERQGLTGRATVFQNMLVFRRIVEAEAAEPVPAPLLPLAQDSMLDQPLEPVDLQAGTQDEELAPSAIADTLTRPGQQNSRNTTAPILPKAREGARLAAQ